MLLLKYLELRAETPPMISTVADDFVEFVAPVDGVVPRPRERVYRYLQELESRKLARIVGSDPAQTSTIEITEIGLLSARGIGLAPMLTMQWKKQDLRLSASRRQDCA